MDKLNDEGDSNKDLIFSFKNDSDKDVTIIIDPPCIDFSVKSKELIKLFIHGYRENQHENVSSIITIRYEEKCINIDVNYFFPLSVEIGQDKIDIW